MKLDFTTRLPAMTTETTDLPAEKRLRKQIAVP